MRAGPPADTPYFQRLRGLTLPGLLLERARATPDRVAFRAKDLGIYQEVTWRQYAGHVARFALGLATLGFEPGQTAAIMGNPCPEWMYADLGIQAACGISYGIYPTSSPMEMRYLLEHGEATVFIAENQEYLDKVLKVTDALPRLRHLIVIDTRAIFMYRDPRIISFAGVEALGQARLEQTPEAFEQMVARVGPKDVATIVYTSGTTANPKGVTLSHGRHLAACANLPAHYPELQDANTTTAYLPLSHVLGRDLAITLPLFTALVPHFGEDPEAFGETLFEVGPTIFVTVPRYLQKMASHILVCVETTSPIKRAAYRAAMAIGRRYIRHCWERDAPLWLQAAYQVARWAVFRSLLDKVGLFRVRLALCGGAPLPPEVMALWQIWGVNLQELYGQTETGGGMITGQSGRFPRPGNVGRPAPGIHVRLAPDGEVLVAGPDFFDGYWKDEAATRRSFEDGWLLTGDIGEWTEQGDLCLVDRKRDILITSGGKNVSPAQVENALRASPYLNEVVAFGDSRPYVSALVEIDYETVAEWARAHGVTYTGYTSLASDPRVYALIGEEVARANRQLARVEQVKAFRILPRELDPEQEGEPITPTRKVKRRLMYEQYRELVESMYTGEEERRIAAQLESLELGGPQARVRPGSAGLRGPGNLRRGGSP